MVGRSRSHVGVEQQQWAVDLSYAASYIAIYTPGYSAIYTWLLQLIVIVFGS